MVQAAYSTAAETAANAQAENTQHNPSGVQQSQGITGEVVETHSNARGEEVICSCLVQKC